MIAMQQSPFENSTPQSLELRAPRQMQMLVPGAVALGGVMACLILNFLPSSTGVMKFTGDLVLLIDVVVAIFLFKMFASRRVRADAFGLSIRGPGGEKTIAWHQVASYERVSERNGAYLSVRDAAGEELGKIESFLGTRDERKQLAAILDARTQK